MRNKTVLIFLAMVLFVTVAAFAAQAKTIMIGPNKGKEVPTKLELEQQQTEKLNNSLQEVKKSQDQTNKLLEELTTHLQEQNKAMQVSLDKLVEQSAPGTEKNPVVIGDPKSHEEDMVELQKRTNSLLEDLIEEQKWLGAILQGYSNSGASVGKQGIQ